MYIKNNKTFIDMMRGGTVTFTQYELWTILTHQNELGINTLHIQKTSDGHFVCCVDVLTRDAYYKEYVRVSSKEYKD